MKLPIYIAIPSTYNNAELASSVGASLHSSTHGGDIVTRVPEEFLSMPIGAIIYNTIEHNVFQLYAIKGETIKVWRALKMHPLVVGPFTRHSAIDEIKTLLEQRRTKTITLDGEQITTTNPYYTQWCIAGDNPEVLDQMDYLEGSFEDGSEDKIVFPGE